MPTDQNSLYSIVGASSYGITISNDFLIADKLVLPGCKYIYNGNGVGWWL